MKHLILCREYPPASGGGIGTYVFNISRLLSEAGEIVHVIAQAWKGAEPGIEQSSDGRLVIHRLPFEDWKAIFPPKPHPALMNGVDRALFRSGFYLQSFAWRAGLLAERLVVEEEIDLIEAQEYEAPLYYFLIRRALGQGPARQPPVLVHLHSPTEFIARYNDWSPDSTWVQIAKRLEDYCIHAADVLFSPSQTFADQAREHYPQLRAEIRVIPLPLGEVRYIERPVEVWENGRIVYAGRLERRKGILEWLQAAVIVAHQKPETEFEFVGTNILGNNRIDSQVIINDMVPPGLRNRFHFRGGQARTALFDILSKARLAVVPSRWENFPYSCIEAMASGLPVLATHQGGMVEMIEDGRSGWLTNGNGRDGLIEGLQRALTDSAVELAEKGREASSSIRRFCDNQEILARHLESRHQLAGMAPARSTQIPSFLPFGVQSSTSPTTRRSSRKSGQEDLALVIYGVGNLKLLKDTMQSISLQTRKPRLLVLCAPASIDRYRSQAGQFIGIGKQIFLDNIQAKSFHQSGLRAISESGVEPLGVIFLKPGQRLSPECLAECESALQRCPGVGVVSYWIQTSEREQDLYTSPPPSFPYQEKVNEAASASALRFAALKEIYDQTATADSSYDTWDIVNKILTNGWAAVTLPKVLLIDCQERQFQARARNTPKANDPWTQRLAPELVVRHPVLTAKAMLAIVVQAARNANHLLQ